MTKIFKIPAYINGVNIFIRFPNIPYSTVSRIWIVIFRPDRDFRWARQARREFRGKTSGGVGVRRVHRVACVHFTYK